MKKILLLLGLLLPIITFGQDVDSANQIIATDSGKVFRQVDKYPYFRGNINQYLAKNIKYPKEAREWNITGLVTITFIIEKNGRVSNVKIEKGLGYGCDEEVIRVFEKMPKWTIPIKDGVPVRFFLQTSVRFALE